MYGNNNYGAPAKRPPPMGRAGSRALREKQSNSNLNHMFNSNSAVQNIPANDMNRFRNMQNQVNPQSMQELEHWRNQSMYLMQQMQQMQEKMQYMQAGMAVPGAVPGVPPPAAAAAAGAAPNAAAAMGAVASLPPRPPMIGGVTPPVATPAVASTAASPPAAAPIATSSSTPEIHAALNGIAELRNVVRSLDARIQQLTSQYNDVDSKIIELYKYLNEWNAALQDPSAPMSSSGASTGGTDTSNLHVDDSSGMDSSAFLQDSGGVGMSETMDQGLD